LASEMAVIESMANRDAERRRRALALLPDHSEITLLNDAIWSRGGMRRSGFQGGGCAACCRR
jgi:hypothetical protein